MHRSDLCPNTLYIPLPSSIYKFSMTLLPFMSVLRERNTTSTSHTTSPLRELSSLHFSCLASVYLPSPSYEEKREKLEKLLLKKPSYQKRGGYSIQLSCKKRRISYSSLPILLGSDTKKRRLPESILGAYKLA